MKICRINKHTHDFIVGLTQLLDPDSTIAELRDTLDGVRLGLTAHAEAEDILLGRFARNPELTAQISRSIASHLAQENALATLVTMPLGTEAWRDRVHHLRELVRFHAADEDRVLGPTLRLHPEYGYLAGAFATERLCQLAMLQPSVPVLTSMFASQRAADL